MILLNANFRNVSVEGDPGKGRNCRDVGEEDSATHRGNETGGKAGGRCRTQQRLSPNDEILQK